MTIADEQNHDEDEQLLISVVTLTTEVIADNGGSLPLYKRLAFGMVGQV